MGQTTDSNDGGKKEKKYASEGWGYGAVPTDQGMRHADRQVALEAWRLELDASAGTREGESDGEQNR